MTTTNRAIPSPRGAADSHASSVSDTAEPASKMRQRRRWGMGILQDELTDEVPGSVLLMSKSHKNNAPLGLLNVPRRASTPSLPSSPYPQSEAMFGPQSEAMFRQSEAAERRLQQQNKKKTKDGKIILEPQPEDTANDPLNWRPVRRDIALLSIGIYCMLGGGLTPILAAGYNDVAADYGVDTAGVALTTGLYMLGLGVGSVIFSPTAIILGKRPVYLATSIMLVLSAVWCALSPSYASLVVARVFQGIAVSPVECLPSATIAEIFFLHERAYRLGIYTLLLLGGKNLVPLASAAIIGRFGWRWVFWIVAMVAGACSMLLFFFVPETFWDRRPQPHKSSERKLGLKPSLLRRISAQHGHKPGADDGEKSLPGVDEAAEHIATRKSISGALAKRREGKRAHFGGDSRAGTEATMLSGVTEEKPALSSPPVIPALSKLGVTTDGPLPKTMANEASLQRPLPSSSDVEAIAADSDHDSSLPKQYTDYYRAAPPKSFAQRLRPFEGRLGHDNWFKIAARPFVLFAYPAILWSSAVYMLSVGWLIVLSESVSTVFISRDTYNFTPLQTGLVYISPFVGGVLGTAVAGKVSDIIVRAMSRRNGGVYEPEFRLVMAIPVAITTAIGLMGFGWSAQERDAWIVPVIFFGIISFGCCIGSTTAITFAVDSYRQYAGEALVTLNWSKNVFHGLVFSLFFNKWLDADGSRLVFLVIGGIQLGIMLFTVPMYIYGKRARMWTVRKRMMERF